MLFWLYLHFGVCNVVTFHTFWLFIVSDFGVLLTSSGFIPNGLLVICDPSNTVSTLLRLFLHIYYLSLWLEIEEHCTTFYHLCNTSIWLRLHPPAFTGHISHTSTSTYCVQLQPLHCITFFAFHCTFITLHHIHFSSSRIHLRIDWISTSFPPHHSHSLLKRGLTCPYTFYRFVACSSCKHITESVNMKYCWSVFSTQCQGQDPGQGNFPRQCPNWNSGPRRFLKSRSRSKSKIRKHTWDIVKAKIQDKEVRLRTMSSLRSSTRKSTLETMSRQVNTDRFPVKTTSRHR